MAKYTLSIRRYLNGPVIHQFESDAPLPAYNVGDTLDLTRFHRGSHRIERIAHLIAVVPMGPQNTPEHVFGTILDVEPLV